MNVKADFDAWMAKYGRSECNRVMRAHLKKRLDVEERPPRERVSPSVRKDMYARQSGICSICGKLMSGSNLSALDVDHINPNLTDSAFNNRSNRRLCHASCNRSKGAKSVPEQAKRYGKTMTEILGDEP